MPHSICLHHCLRCDPTRFRRPLRINLQLGCFFPLSPLVYQLLSLLLLSLPSHGHHLSFFVFLNLFFFVFRSLRIFIPQSSHPSLSLFQVLISLMFLLFPQPASPLATSILFPSSPLLPSPSPSPIFMHVIIHNNLSLFPPALPPNNPSFSMIHSHTFFYLFIFLLCGRSESQTVPPSHVPGRAQRGEKLAPVKDYEADL